MSKLWEGIHRGSWVDSDEATCLSSTDIKCLSIDLNIIKLDTVHIFEFDWVPVNISLEFRFIVIAHSHLWGWSYSKREHVVFKNFLTHHFIESRSYTWFGESWIAKANNCLKIISRENGFLVFNITEFLVFDENLATTITASKSNIICIESSSKASWAESNLCSLSSFCVRLRQRFIIGLSLRWLLSQPRPSSQISLLIKNPHIGRASIENTSYLLWWISNLKIG